MIGKILKGELLLLFLFTVTSFVAFYYSETLPDNYLVISSKQESVNFITYYLTSFVSFIGYYTGPWIFFPFLMLALTNSFIFSKRDFYLDILSIVFLGLTLIPFFFLVAPEFLGRGLIVLIKSIEASSSYLIPFSAFAAICYFSVTFRKSFLQMVMSVSKAVWRVVKFTPHTPKMLKYLNFFALFKKIKLKFSPKMKLQLNGFLRGKAKVIKNEQADVIPVEEKDIDIEENQKEEINSSEIAATPMPGASALRDKLKQIKKTSVRPSVDQKKPVEFSSEELISCIANKKYDSSTPAPDDQYFRDIIERIDEKLEQFRIDGEILSILKGPVVDTFELELGAGVRVSKLNSIVDDLSLALYGAPIRIVYPMRGRTTVGIEVPRNPREIIYLDDVLKDDAFINCNKKLPIAMGKNAFGEIVVDDLASMPHMLVAGSTGTGKSVFINSLLVSLLVKRSPKEMKLILIDPKQLELTLYANLPHLIMPVITNAKEASLAFLWAVQEMEKRYSILKELGVRNIAGFNEKIKKVSPEVITRVHELYPEGEEDDYYLPYIVLIVDEFADLMHTKAGKEIETNVCRLAQKARAAGVHIVLATQRPSVDVVTGLIKNNFPSRVSFRVTTSIDSRTILNKAGAEKLLGRGDMLFRSEVEINRVHSPYVDENEIEVLTDKLSLIPKSFRDDAVEFLNGDCEYDKQTDAYTYGSHISTGLNSSSSKDELYDEAVRIVVEHRSASASMLQRRLNIGYNRAANLVEAMEEDGIVGPGQGSKPRKVLIAADL